MTLSLTPLSAVVLTLLAIGAYVALHVRNRRRRAAGRRQAADHVHASQKSAGPTLAEHGLTSGTDSPWGWSDQQWGQLTPVSLRHNSLLIVPGTGAQGNVDLGPGPAPAATLRWAAMVKPADTTGDRHVPSKWVAGSLATIRLPVRTVAAPVTARPYVTWACYGAGADEHGRPRQLGTLPEPGDHATEGLPAALTARFGVAGAPEDAAMVGAVLAAALDGNADVCVHLDPTADGTMVTVARFDTPGREPSDAQSDVVDVAVKVGRGVADPTSVSPPPAVWPSATSGSGTLEIREPVAGHVAGAVTGLGLVAGGVAFLVAGGSWPAWIFGAFGVLTGGLMMWAMISGIVGSKDDRPGFVVTGQGIEGASGREDAAIPWSQVAELGFATDHDFDHLQLVAIGAPAGPIPVASRTQSRKASAALHREVLAAWAAKVIPAHVAVPDPDRDLPPEPRPLATFPFGPLLDDGPVTRVRVRLG